MKYMLPKLIRDFVQAFPVTADDYYPIDIYAVRKNDIRPLPVQVKSRPTYSIDDFPTTKIDKTAYEDLRSYGLLIILYPKDRKVLVYNHREMKDAYSGTSVTKNVKTWRQSRQTWEYEDKELTSLTISKGRTYAYEQFGIE